jgi:hypothetical protein
LVQTSTLPACMATLPGPTRREQQAVDAKLCPGGSFEQVRGVLLVHTGCCCAGMTLNMRKQLKVQPSYGYCHPDCGMQPPAGVHADQTLQFLLQLCSWYPAKQVRWHGWGASHITHRTDGQRAAVVVHRTGSHGAVVDTHRTGGCGAAVSNTHRHSQAAVGQLHCNQFCSCGAAALEAHDRWMCCSCIGHTSGNHGAATLDAHQAIKWAAAAGSGR